MKLDSLIEKLAGDPASVRSRRAFVHRLDWRSGVHCASEIVRSVPAGHDATCA
jgi:hypothetical protein